MFGRNAALGTNQSTLNAGWLCRGWGGPHDAGSYNSKAWETGFFVSDGGSWDTDYGRFFLGWYSKALLDHADRILTAAQAVLDRKGMPRKLKAERQVGRKCFCRSAERQPLHCISKTGLPG